MKPTLDQIKVTREVELIEEEHIYKEPIIDLILSALLQTPLSESERDRPRLCNEDVVKLAEARLSESVIVRVIELYDCDFDTSRTALLNLGRCGIGMKVVEAMLFRKFKSLTQLFLMDHTAA